MIYCEQITDMLRKEEDPFMLIQFSVENHRSIKAPVVISFAASKDKSLESNLLHPDNKKALLPVLALYGANAAGKSNVLHALMTMWDMVTGLPATLSKGKKLPWEPFAGNDKRTTLEVMYMYRQVRYVYGFSFDAERIYTEYLYHWPNGREALVFSRENGEYVFRENVAEQTTLAGRTPENKLYLVSSNEWNLAQTENAYQWFFKNLIFIVGQNDVSAGMIAKICREEDQKARILKELLLADLGIFDVSVDITFDESNRITTTHRIIREDGQTEYFRLPMELESSGTRRFFAQIGYWLQALETGALLVVDGIECNMHPLLTRRLIELVQDSTINTNGAQLLFTTHDAMLLDLDFFRRDQIWFAEKEERSCATKLYSLASFSPRKGENIRKGYLQGRFGAIPFIGDDRPWQE